MVCGLRVSKVSPHGNEEAALSDRESKSGCTFSFGTNVSSDLINANSVSTIFMVEKYDDEMSIPIPLRNNWFFPAGNQLVDGGDSNSAIKCAYFGKLCVIFSSVWREFEVEAT